MSTLVSQLHKGEIPAKVRKVSQEEGIELQELIEKISQGKVVIPGNKLRQNKSVGIGEGLRTKVNANLGTSQDFPYLEEELEKLKAALKAGTDTVMDLSTAGNLRQIRQKLLSGCALPLGTVPIYQVLVEGQEKNGNMIDFTAEDLFGAVEEQAKEGVDFMTIHAGVNRRALEALSKQKRITDVVSRGGAFTIAWMLHYDKENPFYQYFDRLIEIAYDYDVTLSLGDGMRPGSLADASDAAQIQELLTLGELVARARERQVQVMVEGPGHLPLDHVEANVKLEKGVCRGAPFYLLGPLVTDIAAAHDHIAAAIGGALAAASGADFLCVVTPREHLGLPTAEDLYQGVVAARLAGHAGDIVKGVRGARDWDRQMSKARKALDWEAQLKLALDPFGARHAYQERRGSSNEVCTMCSNFCAMKLISEFLGSEELDKCL